MKLKFKNQDFQTTAVGAVCDLFSGQEKKQATFSVMQDNQMNFLQNEYGIGNGYDKLEAYKKRQEKQSDDQ